MTQQRGLQASLEAQYCQNEVRNLGLSERPPFQIDQLLLFNHNLTSFFPAVNSSRPSGCQGEFEDGNLGGERGPKTQRLTCSALVWLCPSGLEGYVYDIRFHFYSYPSSSKMLLTFCYSSQSHRYTSSIMTLTTLQEMPLVFLGWFLI